MPVQSQVAGAVERAAARAAARKAAERAGKENATAAAANAARRASDVVVRRWTLSMCNPAKPCPLPEGFAKTFNGGSYNEVILGSDTVLYRVYSNQAHRLGRPGDQFTYWSRSDARNTQAVMDSAIEVSRYGNTAQSLVAVRVPRGTRIFEGDARGIDRGGPVGGGNQVVLESVRPEWVVSQ